jgi:hypothetical protein
MGISKTISILFLSSMLFIVSTVIASDKFVSTEVTTSGEDALFVGMLAPSQGSPGMPKGLSEKNFPLEEQTGSREPASVKPVAHWSATASEGFQYKIRVKKQLSSVWVLKRNDRYDLVFASSSGSRVNLTIPAEQFYALKNAASDLRAPASDMNKCKDNYVQIEVVEEKSRKSIEACLSAKGPQAEQIRQFGSALSALVR